MKKTSLILLAAVWSLTASAQFVAKVQITEDIAGICDKSEVYALFPSLEGQEEAICPMTDEEILVKDISTLSDTKSADAETALRLALKTITEKFT